VRKKIIRTYYHVIEWLLIPVMRFDVTANFISLASVVVSFVSGLLYACGIFFWGGIVLLLSGLLDTCDGSIARLRGQSTRFGALLDSTLDRYSDFWIFAGLLFYYRNHWVFALIVLSIIGSFMVSYVKARAESLGATGVVGLMQRPERLLLIAAASLLAAPFLWPPGNSKEIPVIAALCILSVLTNTTALHRLFAAKRELS
jgi:CDP-diacylglycerol---glycerol-3-phosphate 3-phosphatidyltransferase